MYLSNVTVKRRDRLWTVFENWTRWFVWIIEERNSFFKCSDQKSISTCLFIPKRRIQIHLTRRIEIHQLQPTGVTFRTCVHLHEVTWNCDSCISIRLICFVCGTMDMKTYTRTLKAEIQQSIHFDMSVFLLCFCSHCTWLTPL